MLLPLVLVPDAATKELAENVRRRNAVIVKENVKLKDDKAVLSEGLHKAYRAE